MSNSILTTTGVVTASTQTNTVTSTSCSTPHLSSLFANFMIGEYGNTMNLQKSFSLFEGSITDIRNSYESVSSAITIIPTIYVRTSSVSAIEGGNYAATFIATVQGNEYRLSKYETIPELTLGLYAGDYLLALTTFSSEIYDKLTDGSRVDIKWTLELSA